MVTNKQSAKKKGFLGRAYDRAFKLGALKPHAETLLPYLNSKGGRFVEIGSKDGGKESLTSYLESALGWKGILVEPWPHLFQRCRKNRKASVTLNVAATELLLRDSYIAIKGKPPEASVRKTLIEEAKARTDGRPVEAPPKKAAKQVNYVSTNSIAGILDRAEFETEFDLMVFNLCGYEDRALEGMDFEKYKPTYLLFKTFSTNVRLPGLPHCYQKVASSPHDGRTILHLFRFADFGVN